VVTIIDSFEMSIGMRNTPYGICIPFIQNAMTEHNFKFVRMFPHFADNDKCIRRGNEGYDVLFKVRYVLDVIMKGLDHAWNAGEKVTIDESMIHYNGRVDFVQYMPRKPIKHGIKVFTICCSVTAVLLGFEIYAGKENGASAAVIAIR